MNFDKSKNQRKTRTDEPRLLESLVKSRFFQILRGNPFPARPVPPKRGGRKLLEEPRQSLGSIATDIVIFAILVLVAPFWTMFRWMVEIVHRYWWLKFVMGILVGLVCLALGIVLLRALAS